MGADRGDPVYYVINDLHIGGDEQLEQVDFLDELLAFLERLEQADENAELIINGDAFGLWEFTRIAGLEKFDALVETYPDLFDQFKATGETVTITLIPGNHDHELAAYDGYVERFAAYNINLVQAKSITRSIGDRVIWFEHGHQQDPNNRIEDFGNPYAKPLGYYYNTHVTSRAGQLSDRGRFNWLKDLQAVTPTERMPIWLTSKYFYREMNPVLRYGALPFLLLFNLTWILVLLSGIHFVGIWSTPVEMTRSFLGQFGLAGTAAWMLLGVNVTIAALLLIIAIPLYVLVRDIKQTVNRFGILEDALTVDPERPYIERARDIVKDRPEVGIYCFGHTHRPTVRSVEGCLLVNPGTWLKRLHRHEVIAGILPPVFYPSYRIFIGRITRDEDVIRVEMERIHKDSPIAEDLTWTERLLTIGHEPDPNIPSVTTIPATLPDQTADSTQAN